MTSRSSHVPNRVAPGWPERAAPVPPFPEPPFAAAQNQLDIFLAVNFHGGPGGRAPVSSAGCPIYRCPRKFRKSCIYRDPQRCYPTGLRGDLCACGTPFVLHFNDLFVRDVDFVDTADALFEHDAFAPVGVVFFGKIAAKVPRQPAALGPLE